MGQGKCQKNEKTTHRVINENNLRKAAKNEKKKEIGNTNTKNSFKASIKSIQAYSKL